MIGKSKIVLSREWEPGQAMDVQWKRPALGGYVVNVANTYTMSCFPPGFPPGGIGPGGLEPPMLERPYLAEEIERILSRAMRA